ncbi:TPA: LPXTG cell wall anchor domain-containing protein [Streptococcus suis]|nr:LPXTG cell wall anchor domain-containing protein [Streptococcus suis]
MKRSSRKKRLAKWSKLGLSLAAVTVLGGVVEPGVADFVSPKVYAETYVNTSDQLIGVVIWYIAENTDGSSFRLNGDGGYMEVQPGQEIRSSAPNYDGYTLSHTSYTPPTLEGGDGILRFVYKQNKIAEQPEEPVGDANSNDTSAVSQPTSSQPTVEDRYDVVTLKYRDENGKDLGEDLMMVYPTSPQMITPPAFEGYEFREASVGENYLMYSKPISLPYEHRFAQVLTEQDLNNHSDFLGGRIKESLDSLRNGSAYTYILNYRKTSPSQQAPQTKRVCFIIDVKPDVVTGTSSFDGFSRRYVYLHPGESYTFPIDESRFEIRPNQKLTYSYDEVEAGKDYSISVRPKAVTSQPAEKPIETPTDKPVVTPTDKPAETPVEQPVEQPVETPVAPQPAETSVVTPADKPAETLVDSSVTKPAETLSETPAKSPAETPTNVQPSVDQAGQSATEPTVLSKQDSPAGTASLTGQSAPGKQETKQETKEPAAPASPSKQSTDKPAPTSQPQTKSLPATGDAHSVWHMTGLGLLGLAGLVVKRRSRKSS